MPAPANSTPVPGTNAIPGLNPYPAGVYRCATTSRGHGSPPAAAARNQQSPSAPARPNLLAQHRVPPVHVVATRQAMLGTNRPAVHSDR
jgi:hypothetical protein